MPNYEFECPDCGGKIVLNMSADDRNLPVNCDKCDAIMMRLISAPAVVFKGAGWETNDHKHG
jgi:putative FmdB family regulatory protein